MKMQWNFGILCLLLCLFSSSQAQKSTSPDWRDNSLFKIVPLIRDEDPEWVHLMYSDHPNIYEVEDAYHAYYTTHVFEKNEHTQNYKYWLQKAADYISPEGDLLAVDDNLRASKIMRFRQQRYGQSTQDIWTNIGPFRTYRNDGSEGLRPTQANVYCMAVAPSNTDILYCGTESGGLFKSVDKGMNWTLISRDEIFTNASDVKVHPSNPNKVYIAFNKGIYRTDDGGESWQNVYKSSAQVEQFYISSKEPNIIFAATSKNLMQSVDGGDNWKIIRSGRCWDIVAHPTKDNVLYIAIDNPKKKRAEIYKSEDAGITWSLKDNNWYVPADINNARDIGCKLGVTKADPNRLYACLIGESKAGDNGWIGIYYSMDEGDNWVNADGRDGGPYVSGSDASTNWFVAGYSSGYHQGWYNFDLAISSKDPDKLWLGTIWFCESGNRGKNIEYIRGTRRLEMHADIQDIDVVGDEIWIVSDGGINYSKDECQTVETRNNGITASNYWGFSQGWNEDTWTGGRYHNGDAVYHENYGTGNTLFMGGAEASTGYINPLNNRLSYYSDINSVVAPDVLNMATTRFSKLALYPNESYAVLNSSEIEHHPLYANTMYLGRDNIFYKSVDEGASFESIFEFPNDSRVLEFEISRVNPQIIYAIVRKDGSKLYKSTDGGNTFKLTQPLPTSNRSTYDISLNPMDPNNLWITVFNGYNGQKVYQSLDGGLSWINRTTLILDNHRIFDVLYQGGTDDVVYIVTANALFYWSKEQQDWVIYAEGLPFVVAPLKMIAFYRDGLLRLATSRGIWEAPLAEKSLPSAQMITSKKDINCSRKQVQFEDNSILRHEGAKWEWEFPGATSVSSTQIHNPLVTFSDTGSYNVKLTVTDENGESSTQSIAQMISVESDYCQTEPYPQMALSCYGSNRYAQNTSIQLDYVDSFTFTAWIKPNGIQADYSGIFSMGSDPSFKNVLNFRGGNNTLGFHWNSGQWGWNSGLVVPSDEWSYVAITVTPSGATLYVNEEKAVRQFAAEPVNIRSIILGSYYGWSSRNFNGLIEEACFWNRALSEDEIRLARHLTKQDITDESLFAYYQFNHDDFGVVYDKKSNNDLLISGAELTLSMAPIGPGIAEMKEVLDTENANFDSVGVRMYFDASSEVPDGEVVVSKIQVLSADVLDLDALNSTVWIMNNYGQNKNFTPLDSLRFTGVENLDTIQSATEFFLQKRASNSGNKKDWRDIEHAALSFNKSSKWVLFDGGAISDDGQFYLGSDLTLSLAEEQMKGDVLIYPNPVMQGNDLIVSGISDPFTFTLVDETGREMAKQRIMPKEHFSFSNIPNGIYFYRIVTKSKMYAGKLIVQ